MYNESYKIKVSQNDWDAHTQKKDNNMLEIKYRYIIYGQEIRGSVQATSKEEGIKKIKQQSPKRRHGLMIKVEG